MSKRIIICDSGLGGLNVAESFFCQKQEFSGGEGYEIIYFNAFPDVALGYNDLPDDRAKEEVFMQALEGMKKFDPQMCLIACNTLSIIYDRLKAYYTPAFPVRGIVECAIEGMSSYMKKTFRADLLILGTLTTVQSGVYDNAVAANGVERERIYSLAVPGLAKNLESGVDTPAVNTLIEEAAEKSLALFRENDPDRPLALGLCCTHYGFAAKRLTEVFRTVTGRKEAVILNPNAWMCPDSMRGMGESFSYVSRIGFFPGSRENMSSYFAERVPCIGEALASAQEDALLFEIPSVYLTRS